MTDLQVWVLDRKMFQQIMMRTGMQRIEENLSFLTSVPLLKNLSLATLHKIADVLEVVRRVVWEGITSANSKTDLHNFESLRSLVWGEH